MMDMSWPLIMRVYFVNIGCCRRSLGAFHREAPTRDSNVLAARALGTHAPEAVVDATELRI
jgi:hypothetical protein